jgi:hypothetical protein
MIRTLCVGLAVFALADNAAAIELSDCLKETNNQVRLVCYDRVTGYRGEKRDVLGNVWHIRERPSPLDDRLEVVAVNTDKVSSFVLGARCKDGYISVMIVSPHYLGSDDSVQIDFRAGESQPTRDWWMLSADKTLVTSRWPEEFLKKYEDNTPLFIRITDGRGKQHDMNFMLGRFSEVRDAIYRACKALPKP